MLVAPRRGNRGRVEPVLPQATQQAESTSAGRGPLGRRDVGENDEDPHDAQYEGDASATIAPVPTVRLPNLRSVLRTGAAGEARTAGNRQIASNVVLQYAGRVIALLVGVVTVPLLARSLGASEFGIYTSALAYVGIFSSLTEFGLGSAATMRMSQDPDNEADWLGALASLRTLFSIGASIACAAIIPIAFDGEESRIVALILTATILFAGAGALMAVFQSRLRAAVPLAINAAQSVLWLSVVLALTSIDGGPVVIAIGYTATLGAAAALQVYAARRVAKGSWRGARERWRSLLSLALPIGLASVFISIYFSLDAVLLLDIGGDEEAGIYGAAYRILTPLLFLPQAIMMALFPVMAALKDTDEARLQRIVQRCAVYLAVVSVPLLAITLVLSPQIISLLFGSGYERTATVLPILMIALVSIGYGTLAGFLAPVLGLQWRLTLFAFIGACLNVVLNIILIPHYGAVGSAWATVVTEVLTMVLLLGTCLVGLHLRLRVSPIAATFAAAGLMMVAMAATEGIGLIPALIAGGITYCVSLLALRVVSIDELRSLVEA
jgi:O-antigen/teichoic acid export membrane protein